MSIYEHFRKDEHPFVEQVLDWKRIVDNDYCPKLTDFLDPRQQRIVELVVGNPEGVLISFWGGHARAERKRALLYPEYYLPEPADYAVTAYELEYPSKFVALEHRQVLGALMSIGLKREKYGDILTQGSRIQLMLSEEVADYVELNFQSAGKAKISLKPLVPESVITPENEQTERSVTVSSMRLDTVTSEAFNLSRSKIKPEITGEKVKVNWKTVDDPSFILEAGDMLSVRGKGRCSILAAEGMTKKGKQRLLLGFPK